MSSRIQICRAGLQQAGAVALLFEDYRQFYGQRADLPGARRFLRERLRKRESVIFVAINGREPVGFVQLYPSFDSVSLGRIWILYDLFVTPGLRRSGVGRALMEQACRYARRTGAVKIVLETAVDNRAAQRLYRKLGWKRDTKFDRYYLELNR